MRKTPFLEEMQAKGLHDHIAATLRRYQPDLLRRAATYLYLKETHSSFEVEREHPSTSRAQRFADLLREAQSGTPLSDERIRPPCREYARAGKAFGGDGGAFRNFVFRPVASTVGSPGRIP